MLPAPSVPISAWLTDKLWAALCTSRYSFDPTEYEVAFVLGFRYNAYHTLFCFHPACVAPPVHLMFAITGIRVFAFATQAPVAHVARLPFGFALTIRSGV